MTEINEKLLELILAGRNLNAISYELHLSPKQIRQRLNSIQNSGYNLGFTILDYGTTNYDVIHDSCEPATHTANIKLVKEPNKFVAMVISDIHTGNIDDKFKRLDLIYEYCLNNGINIIINCGDLIDNISPNRENYLDSPRKQIEYLIENHPHHDYILNLVCFGNHDYTALKKSGLDVSKLLCNSRPDFISLGYSYGLINVLNSQIVVRHQIDQLPFNDYDELLNGKLLLYGHRHKMKALTCRNKFIVNVPTLSDVIFDKKTTMPGAVKLEIAFNDSGYFDQVEIEHLVVTDKIFSLSETNYKFSSSGIFIDENQLGCKRPKVLIR